MNGWLLDIYPDHGTNSMVCWIKTPRGVQRVEDSSFLPKIYVHSSPERMRELEQALPILDAVKAVGREMKRTWLGEDEREVLAVTIGRYSKVEDVAHTVDNRGKYRDYSLFNVDLRFSQRYLLEKDIFPMGLMELGPEPRMLDDPYAIDYGSPAADERGPVPQGRLAARGAVVRRPAALGDGRRPHGGRGRGACAQGHRGPAQGRGPGHRVHGRRGRLRHAVPLRQGEGAVHPAPRLGRDEDDLAKERQGQVVLHLRPDTGTSPRRTRSGAGCTSTATSSFMFMESGLNGLIDLSRISGVPVQELSRLSPGSAISAMEVNQAVKDGCVGHVEEEPPGGVQDRAGADRRRPRAGSSTSRRSASTSMCWRWTSRRSTRTSWSGSTSLPRR